MATHGDGHVRTATANSVKAAARSATSRQCPKCGRKSALRYHSDDFCFGTVCRWDGCGYENLTMRTWDDE
jgi:predicted RNA-binding Zn-ribbon protein involved in translation (DUF1610 family)